MVFHLLAGRIEYPVLVCLNPQYLVLVSVLRRGPNAAANTEVIKWMGESMMKQHRTPSGEPLLYPDPSRRSGTPNLQGERPA
ncbi:hypothetical protein AHiyo8_03820 [Arthrobacter sp. Hiyo8]|nr:hypothetical protein AHiyo8_03820 [Arthrobacter sp. Hiyo8]